MLDPRREALIRRTFIDYKQTSEFLERPLVLDRAEGLYYWDIEGRRYFDAIGGIFVASLGHGHPRVMDAMRRQMKRLMFAPPMHGIADVTLDFVERLGHAAPPGLTFVKPFSGGSETVEAALKLVRQYFKQTGRPGKYKFISQYLGYHGGTFGAMAASGTGKRKTGSEPHMPGFLKVFPPSHYRDQFSSWEECNRFAARAYEDVILAEDPATVAGILIEPISNTAGILTPTAAFFEILREIATRHDVMLIFDEIITFAKTGAMFASQTFNVVPDLICGGKGLSSGAIPLGALLAREDFAEAFIGPAEAGVEFAHGHTFAGHPLACAVGIAVLDEISGTGLDLKALRLGRALQARLEDLKKHGVVREVRGKGILLGVELVRDTDGVTPFPELGNELRKTALETGLILRVNPTWFAVAPALIAEERDLDEMCALIDKSLVAALDACRQSAARR